MSEVEQIILPEGFKRVEYLQSTGNEVIYTGIIPTDKHGFYAEVESLGGTTGYACGTQSAGGSPGFWIYDSNGVLQASYENNTKTTVSTNRKVTIKNNFLNDRKLVADENVVKNYSQSFIYNWSYEFTLFKSTYTANTKFDPVAPIRFYRFKISENEKIIRDFVPCLDVNDTPCMYDILGTGTIEENTYYNQGDGRFLIPKDVVCPNLNNNYNLPAGFKKCVYLQSDGTQWIDTGVIPNIETGFYFKALQLTYGNFIPFGVGEGSNAILVPRFSSKELQYRWGGTNVKMMTWDKADDLIFHSSLNLYNSKLAAFDSEDTDVGMYITSQTGTYTLPIWLFSYNINGAYNATYGKWVGRIFRAQITQGDALIHDYVPCLDADNRPCMYDLIEEEPLYNQSGGTEFTYCVEHQLPSDFVKLKFLESTGNQYIKTGYVPTNTTGLYIDTQDIGSGDTIPMGLRESSSTDTRFFITRQTSSNSAGYGWGTWTGVSSTTGSVRYDSTLNWLNDRKSITSNPLFSRIDKTLPDLPFTPTYSIYMFGVNQANTHSYKFKGRIYRAKISEGTEIVRDFVPALDQRILKPCMYDIINNKAYYNDGTDEFLSNKDYEGDYIGCGVLGGIGNRLGISSIDGIPMDYIRIKFLESTGTQWMNTNYVPTTYTGVYIKYQGTEISLPNASAWPIMSYDDVDHAIAPLTNRYRTSAAWYWQNKVDPGYWNVSSDYVWESTINFYDDGNTSMKIVKNGDLNRTYVLKDCGCPRRFEYTPTDPFRICYVKWNNKGVSPWIIYNVKITEGADLKRNYVPVIDPSGVPCMYDTVTGTPLYNSGTDNFVAGLKNLYDALYLKLSKKGGTITLSLPTNNNTEFYENKIRANNPNWTITFQYH